MLNSSFPKFRLGSVLLSDSDEVRLLFLSQELSKSISDAELSDLIRGWCLRCWRVRRKSCSVTLGARPCTTALAGGLLVPLLLDRNHNTLYNNNMKIPSKSTAQAMAKPMAILTLTLSPKRKNNCLLISCKLEIKWLN